MKNRIADDLLTSTTHGPETAGDPTELLRTAQKRFDQRRRSIEMYIQDHPLAGIGAALFIGVLIGWYSKRK